MGRSKRIGGYDELKKVFQDNLKYAMEHAPKGTNVSQSHIGKKLGLNRQTVYLWAAGKTIPTLDQCCALCAYLGRDIRWMTTSHSFKDESNITIQTYSDAFGQIRPLVDRGIINSDCINDYFLKYLVTRYTEISALKAVDENRKDSWMREILDIFDVPIMPALKHPLFYTYLAEINSQITEDETVIQMLTVVKEMLAQDGQNNLEGKFLHWLSQNHAAEYENLQIEEALTENPNFFDDEE